MSRTVEQRRSDNRAQYLKRKLNHLCQWCGLPVDNGLSRCSKCQSKHNNWRTEEYRKAKIKVMQAYGNGKCQCCGTDILAFLSIDHVNGGGSKERRESKLHGGSVFYFKLIQQGFPPGYRVLCHNCNFGRYINNGQCPHLEIALCQPC